MKINTEAYSVYHTNNTFFLEGSLRLNGLEEYNSISKLLDELLEQEPEKIILNLEKLTFLNSSGISMLSKFVINVRKKKNIQMIVLGNQENPWQTKSLKNLQRLMPSLILELV